MDYLKTECWSQVDGYVHQYKSFPFPLISHFPFSPNHLVFFFHRDNEKKREIKTIILRIFYFI